MKSRILRVGFDLDGVILYNPARIIRPLISMVKRLLLHKKGLKFYYPHSSFEKWMWKQFHRSSIFIAPGMDELKKLVRDGKIEAYIVTARYSFLGKDFIKWVNRNNLNTVFVKVYLNDKDEQPHLFKERMVKKLRLDAFVEDNWDIVDYLSSRKHLNCRILWIYNLFDRKLKYKYKFPVLLHAVKEIEKAM